MIKFKITAQLKWINTLRFWISELYIVECCWPLWLCEDYCLVFELGQKTGITSCTSTNISLLS